MIKTKEVFMRPTSFNLMKSMSDRINQSKIRIIRKAGMSYVAGFRILQYFERMKLVTSLKNGREVSLNLTSNGRIVFGNLMEIELLLR